MLQSNIRNVLLIASLVFAQFAQAQDLPIYSEVKILSDNGVIIQTLNENGLEIDHFNADKDGFITVIKNEKLNVLNQLNIEYEVLVEDLAENAEIVFSEHGFAKSVVDFENFDLGDFANYHSYDEMITSIELMQSLFPEQVQITEIGQSYENRIIYAVKISDNVTVDESDIEGVAYFDALTHAREPNGLFATLYFMWYLLENQDSDPEMSYLIENRELYFVPVVNPDGYVYNQTTNPNGGGFWRKNRAALEGSSCIGVDLNRNYGALWGVSSSNNPCDDTYRGSEAFSELESQAVRDLVDSIEPNTAMSSHAFSGLMIHSPEGANMLGTNIHREFGSEICPENYWGYGEVLDILGMNGTGATIEYIANTHECVAYTPEIGNSFWESASAIWSNAEKMFPAFKFMAYGAGEFSVYHDFKLTDSTPILPGNSNSIEVRLFNRGLGFTSENVSVELSCNHPSIEITNPQVNYGQIESRTYKTNSEDLFHVSISEGLTPGEAIEFTVSIEQNDGFSYSDKFNIYAGEIEVLFSDDAESNSLDNWISSSWQTTNEETYNGEFCFTDSPESNYNSNSSSDIRMNTSIDLTATQNPFLHFDAKWSMENGDNVRLKISTDGGSSWNNLSGTSSYGGTHHWNEVKVDLSSYSDESDVRLGFSLSSNFWRNSDGFYFDNFRIIDIIDPNQTTSISNEITPDRLISVYPNPSSDVVTVKWQTLPDGPYDIRIIDMTRKIVFRELAVTSLSKEISLEELSSGTYHIVISSESGSSSKLLVKN